MHRAACWQCQDPDLSQVLLLGSCKPAATINSHNPVGSLHRPVHASISALTAQYFITISLFLPSAAVSIICHVMLLTCACSSPRYSITESSSWRTLTASPSCCTLPRHCYNPNSCYSHVLLTCACSSPRYIITDSQLCGPPLASNRPAIASASANSLSAPRPAAAAAGGCPLLLLLPLLLALAAVPAGVDRRACTAAVWACKARLATTHHW